MKTACKLTNIL